MVRKKTKVVESQLLRGQPDEFWHQLQVFPDVMRSGVARDYRAHALSQLKKCGVTSLRMLIERAQLPQPRIGASPEQLAANLLKADAQNSLLFLAEFLRNRGQAVNHEYDNYFSQADKRSHQAQLGELSNGRASALRQFAQLLLLYEDDESTLDRVFVRRLWRKRKTTREFVCRSMITPTVVTSIVKKKNDLESTISNAYSGRDLRFFKRVTLGPWEILLLQNEHTPRVSPDFRDTQKTLHGYGWIMLGFERNKHRVLLKGGGKRVGRLVEGWFGRELGMELFDAEMDVFDAYDAKAVENALLGGVSADTKIQISGISFRRTQSPQHSPIIIKAPFAGQNIHRDLQYGREKELFQLRSLSDLEWIQILFNGKDTLANLEVAKRGPVTLSLDNADLSEEDVDEIRTEFLKEFGVPLDRQIDPQSLLLGAVDVYNFLLEAEELARIDEYQKDALEDLQDLGILKVSKVPRLVCKNNFSCKAAGKPVIDEDVVECPECQHDLEETSLTRFQQQESAIRKFVRPILKSSLGWKLATKARSFEKKDFFPLENPERPDQMIRVYFAKRVSKSLLESLDRSHQPVLVVSTGGDVDHAHLDTAGVAHVSLARALAARSNKTVRSDFEKELKVALEHLISVQEEKVYRLARQSRQRVADPPTQYSGEDYERDIFNLIRSIFPYTEFWTGKNRPDGFCSLVYFQNGSQRKPIKCNWSYDAKFTKEKGGYDLNISEQRKMWDYVEAIAALPEVSVQGNELNAHVIISNKLSDAQMKTVAGFMRKEHRLGQDQPNFKVVFVLDQFWCTLYDKIRENESEFRKRTSLLSQKISSMFNEEKEGIVFLDDDSADKLVKWVLKRTRVENPVDTKLLTEELDETMND